LRNKLIFYFCLLLTFQKKNKNKNINKQLQTQNTHRTLKITFTFVSHKIFFLTKNKKHLLNSINKRNTNKTNDRFHNIIYQVL